MFLIPRLGTAFMDSNNTQSEYNIPSNSEKIKMAAMKLFSLYGYGSTTVRMIAQEAGLSAGQIAVHFGSKEELYESIIRDAVRISNEAILPIEEKRDRLTKEGTLTKERLWELISQLVSELIDYCFVPYNRECIMMVNISLPNSPIVGKAKKSFQDTILAKQEMLLAELLQAYSERKGYLKFRVISRAVNGSIVSFAEHSEFLMSEVYSNKDKDQALAYAKGHLKNFVLTSLKNIDTIEDFSNVEKYKI